MNQMNIKNIRITILLLLFLLVKDTGFTQEKFEGFYIGALGGSQNIFGGSNVEGIDVLAQKSGFVMEFPAGFRLQALNERLVLGLEFTLGITDGNLLHMDDSKPLTINYSNSFQRGFGGMAGWAPGRGRNLLLFLYLNETKRTFDVDIRDRHGRYRQKDKQGMLKYGLGLEFPLTGILHIRASAGLMRVDFGDRITNINVEDRGDIMAGLVFQF